MMTFSDLTWDDLTEWAGSRVVARAKSYLRAVEDLRLTADGRLLAWVEGSERYATFVGMNKSGALSSLCTCPYGVSCKHAVAMILAYLDAIRNKKPIPAAEDLDERLDLLTEQMLEDDDFLEDGDTTLLPHAGKKATKQKKKDPDSIVRCYLETLSLPTMLNFVQECANDFPDVRQRILDRAELQSGETATIIASTRRAIEEAAAEPGCTGRWSGESHIPDYSRVRERLESLLASGHPDAVMELGKDLLKRGMDQVGMSHDEGETGQEITRCLEIVFRALKTSSKNGAGRLIWEIDMRLQDEYSLLDGIPGLLDDLSASTTGDWSVVADELARRMESLSVTTGERASETSGRDYRRQAIMRWLLLALRQAGRESEITAILEREAGVTHCYTELVDHLLAGKNESAALEWARKGFERTIETLPGIAWPLEERLRKLAQQGKDRPLEAAFLAMEFFHRPEVGRYETLRKAASALGLWDGIRPQLLHWLETGVRPDGQPATKVPVKSRRKQSDAAVSTPRAEWPLPSTGLHVAGEKGGFGVFLDTATLIAIAIKEGRNDDVLKWYHCAGRRSGFGGDYQGETVAQAVRETHPDEALTIWLRLAKEQIAMTKPAAYITAGGSLRNMEEVYRRTKRLGEWRQLLANLRVEHARKPRLLEVLSRLEGRREKIIGPEKP